MLDSRAPGLTSARPQVCRARYDEKNCPARPETCCDASVRIPYLPSDTATRYAATQETTPIIEDEPIKTRIQVSRLVVISRGMYSGRGLPLLRAISPAPAAYTRRTDPAMNNPRYIGRSPMLVPRKVWSHTGTPGLHPPVSILATATPTRRSEIPVMPKYTARAASRTTWREGTYT